MSILLSTKLSETTGQNRGSTNYLTIHRELISTMASEEAQTGASQTPEQRI
jgi:hypothetical protein